MSPEEEAFEQGFHGLPSPKERARMSAERLAILLCEQTPGTPAYILVEHELNLRIAQVQSHATLWSAGIGALAGVLAAIAGAIAAFVLTSSQVPPQPEAKTRQPTAEKTADETTKAVADVNAPVRVPPPMPNTPTSKSSTEPQKSDTKK